jgi:hypothetical protein
VLDSELHLQIGERLETFEDALTPDICRAVQASLSLTYQARSFPDPSIFRPDSTYVNHWISAVYHNEQGIIRGGWAEEHKEVMGEKLWEAGRTLRPAPFYSAHIFSLAVLPEVPVLLVRVTDGLTHPHIRNIHKAGYLLMLDTSWDHLIPNNEPPQFYHRRTSKIAQVN